MTAPRASAPALGNPLLRALRLGIRRVGYEVRGYFRMGDTVFFTFLFPVVMLGIFSLAFSQSSFGGAPDGTGAVSAAAYYLPGMLAAGLLLSGLQNLGVDIAIERGDGTLKRLAGTPLPASSYLIGKFGQVLVTALLQSVALLLVARLLFGVELPTEPGAWLAFAWIFLLGLAGSALLGVALSRLPRSGKSATAVILPPVLILQFISGVYLPFTQLPEWLQNVASVFPLKWLAQGLRSIFLPEDFAAVEQGGSWNLGGVALVLLLWLVLGGLLTALTFRWIRKHA